MAVAGQIVTFAERVAHEIASYAGWKLGLR